MIGGIYLGFSPNHSRSVALVLNPQTGLVLPQFHVKFDDMFETTEYPHNKQLDPAEWQVKAGFKTKKYGRIQSSNRVQTKPQQQAPPPPQPQPPTAPLQADPDDVWIPEGAEPEEVEPVAPQVETVEPSIEPQRRSQRSWKPTEAIQDMFRQRNIAFPVAFEALAEVGL